MPLPNERTYTIEDIYALPEGERAELIDGQLYMMSPPTYKHQKLVMELSSNIHNYIKSNGGPCEVLPAPLAVRLNADDKTYVEPDISVICDSSKLNDRGCLGAPDWIIEVVTPGSQRIDYMIKLFKYRAAGVKEYWIVDKSKNRIMVYNFEQNDMGEYTFSDIVSACIYENLKIDFSVIDES